MTAFCRRIVEWRWFDPMMLGIIAINAVVLGLETYESIEADYGDTLALINDVILGIFVIELLMRIGATGFNMPKFFKSGWNTFDFIVITASFVPGVRENATLLRLARLLRITRAVRLLPDLRILTVAVARSIPGVASLAAITVLLVYIYGMVGWLIFHETDPEDYGNIGQAMITMFIMLSLENMPDNIAMGQELSNWTLVFFISYVLLASFLIFNLFIGIVINSMEEARTIELHRAEREVLEDETADAEQAHQVILADRLHNLKQSVEELERELAAQRHLG